MSGQNDFVRTEGKDEDGKCLLTAKEITLKDMRMK